MQHPEYTTILRAIGTNNGEMIKTVKDTHYLFSHRDLEVQSYLHLAIHHVAHRVVKSLIEMGCPVNMKDKNGITPLMSLRGDGDETLSIAQDLIFAGANVNDKNLSEMTALHIAASKHVPKRVKVLLDAGANANVVNQKGDTPLAMALRCNHGDNTETFNRVVDLLVEASEINHTTRVALYLAAERNNTHAIEALAKRGANLEARYLDLTPLQTAAMKGNCEVVKCLLEYGVNISATVYYKPIGEEVTARDIAMYLRRYQVVDIITKHELIDDTKYCEED